MSSECAPGCCNRGLPLVGRDYLSSKDVRGAPEASSYPFPDAWVEIYQ
jgi:hypothetical protein